MAIEAGRPFDRAVVLSALLLEFEIRYEAMASGKLTDLMDEYRMRCSTIGQRVRVLLANGTTVEGRVDSIAADGSLRLLRDEPQTTLRDSLVDIRAGDVVHLR
jgi:BirA family biotin operon repressor/biotin-[acetyl-CoA-carboxylase] ligase